jgi:hypothetical protein
MLPLVKIDFINGALGQVSASADGVIGILATGVTVSGMFSLNTPYKISQRADITNLLGLTELNNPGIYKLLNQLFDQSGDGVEVWIIGFADTVTMTTMLTLATIDGVQKLLLTANGKIRTLIVHRTPALAYVPVTTTGIDADVNLAMLQGQITATWATDTLKAPVFVLISGLYYQSDPILLPDLSLATNNRVGIVIGDTVEGNGCAIGIVAGKLAIAPVQRNIGRVKDGAVKGVFAVYLGQVLAEQSDVASIHDKGYITFRTHTGRTGYYFNDDTLAAPVTDDYNHISARRTVDKAYRIAYDTLINELLEEVPVTDEGKVSVVYAKSIENQVENAIVNSMTANGELGNDPANQNDTGVVCFVDVDQNIVSTGLLKIILQVKPYGYSRYINVELGFKTVI